MNFTGIYFDLTFALLTYGFALCNMSASIVASLENYEREAHISDVERRAKDERLNFAVTLLCRASGVFVYIAETVLPDLAKSSPTVPNVPDLSREVITGLSKSDSLLSVPLQTLY